MNNTTRRVTTQKEIIQYCHYQAGGSQEATIALYASYDEDGLVPRSSNVRPLNSTDYACIMWHTALKLGWFE